MMCLFLCTGCFDLGEPPRPAAVLQTSVDGEGPISPTETLAARLSGAVDPESLGAVALVHGEADGALVEALARPPLPQSYLARVVAMRSEAHGDTLLLIPRRALEPEVRHTLVLGAALRAGGSQLGHPVLRAFVTASLAEAAPILQLVDPSDGAAGVVRNLRSLELQWTRPMPQVGFELIFEDGRVFPTRQEGLRLFPLRALDAGQRWQVRPPADLKDEEGRAPFGDPPGFSTGDELRRLAPRLDGPTLEVADRCLVARFSADRSTFAQLCVGDRCESDPRSANHAIGVPLAEPEDGWDLTVWDESTAPSTHRDGLVRMPPVPLVMTEILSDPLGSRLDQQFVEVLNVGDAPVELGGLHLATASGFDVLPQARLDPGRYALLVGANYLGEVPPESLLVRVGNVRLGGRGIRVGGEPIWIETADGTLITRWGGWPAVVAPGQSLSRNPYHCDLPISFHAGPATPGGP